MTRKLVLAIALLAAALPLWATVPISCNNTSIPSAGSASGPSSCNGSDFCYTTNTETPAANNVVLLAFRDTLATGNGAPDVVSVTGNSLTWVNIADVTYGTTVGTGKANRLVLFRALGAAPSSGTIVIDMGTVASTSGTWLLGQCSGVDTGGTNGSSAVRNIVSAVTTSVTSGGTLTVTMGAFAKAINETFAVGAWSASTANDLAGTSMTGLVRNQTSLTARSEWSAGTGNVSPATETWTTTSATWAIIALELVAANQVKVHSSTN